MSHGPREGWQLTALHWQREELTIEYREDIDAQTARTIMTELLIAGRMPPLVRVARRRDWVSLFPLRRLWCGGHQRPEGTYLVAVIGSHCLIGRPVPPR